MLRVPSPPCSSTLKTPQKKRTETMAPVSNVVDRPGGEGQLSIDDCLCPVCLEIFLEPVTLPCTHTFCKSCFLESVDKAAQCCPMCRKRVSTWTRHNSRNKTLVNEQLWRRIQSDFPLQCQRRLSGQDAGAEDHQQALVFCPRVCQPGELRREYQDQVSKLTEEKRVLDEAQRRASEEFIEKLLAAEEAELQAERQRQDEDQRMAWTLSQQLNSSAVSQENVQPSNITPARKKVAVGQIEKFLCPRSSIPTSPLAGGSAPNRASSKSNALLSPLPTLDYNGASTQDRGRQRDQSEPPILHAAPLSSQEAEPSRPESRQVTDLGLSKRKSSELETTEEEEQERVSKRGCPSSSSMEAGPSAPWRLDLEAELLSRRQQEEADRRLALELQKELDQEERQRATNRSKGSADAYPLRQQHRGRAGRAARAKISPSPSPARSSTPGSAPPSSRASGSKQTTLTEMFTNLSS